MAMAELDPIGPAPEVRLRFFWLLLGIAAAPLAWLGQVMLGYGLTTGACYPGDHPLYPRETGALLAALVVCDLVALAICAAGAVVSWRGRRTAKNGRDRFLALWGVLSSLWFFAAILFNVLASLVPRCAG
jgi:hypothetical protein